MLAIKRLPIASRRLFSSTASMSVKREWLIILPDYEGALAKRMEVRATHLNNVKPDVPTGLISFGGATLAEPEEQGKPLQINGSVLLVTAETKEKALERVHTDIYYKSDVWDKSKVQVLPFKTAVRTALQPSS